ncbi:hypothetical protein [Amycolatopsis japonica]
MTEIRHGNRNRRNLYAGPGEEHHIAVTVGPIGHAAAMSAFLADAAKAYIAAGHPMPQPPATSEETIEQTAAKLLDLLGGDSCEDEALHFAQVLAGAGLLADPELQADAERIAQRDHAQAAYGLQGRIDKALTLHTEFKIYDECGHKHTAEDVDAGRAINVPDVGYTCSDGYEYSICRHCCTGDSGFQSEECEGHTRPCWPCSTVAALQSDSASTQASPQATPSVQASGEALEPHECEKCADHVACVCLPWERSDG